MNSCQKRMKTDLSYPRILSPYFRKKVITDCCHPDKTLADTKNCLSDTTEVISKLIGVKFRKSPGNISYSTFQLLNNCVNKSCNMHRGGRKFKLFSAGSGFTSQIFTAELSGVDSAGVLRQCVFWIYYGFAIIYCDIFFQ